ncbi:MAG: CBS domain-containing protein [Methanobacteriota archaeon]
MVYFSELKGRPVFDADKKNIGVLTDLVFIHGGDYAEITHIVCVFEDKSVRKIRFSLVDELKCEKSRVSEKIIVHLNKPLSKITCFFIEDKDLILSEVVDKQVIDVNGAKIVRVNDILLGKVGGKFSVVAVAVGKKSFLKRIGLKSFANSTKLKEQIIAWESVEALEPRMHGLHLKVQKNKIADLHPEDIADVMEDLSHKERVLIFNTLDKQVAAETLIGAEPEVQQSVFRSIKVDRIKELLEDIQTDQAADILSLMDKSEVEEILGRLRADKAKAITKILNYDPESAGAIMDTSFIMIPETHTAQQTIDLLREIAPSSDKIYHIYVVDRQRRLVGILSIRGLLIAPPDEKVGEIMHREVIHVKTDTPKEDIAKTIARYDIFVIPVVSDDNVLRGVVTADDVLTEIMPDEWKRERFKPHRTKKNGKR